MNRPDESRRKLLGLLGAAPLALPVLLSAACSSATPPRQYKRPKSHIVGGSGKRSRISVRSPSDRAHG